MRSKLLWVFGLALIAIISGLTGCSAERVVQAADGQPVSINVSNSQQGIMVNGEGRVTVTPDIANFYLGVTAQAATVAFAQSQAASAMDKIISVLTSNGVAKNDIQTQSYSIQQINRDIYSKTPVLPPSAGSSSSGSSGAFPMPVLPSTPATETVSEYQVSNMLVVKIRSIDKTGPILDSVTAAGGDLVRVNSVSFTVDKPDQYYAQARTLAVKDAQAKASALAGLAGVTLGKATFISENTYPSSYPVPMYRADVSSGMGYSTPINPGQSDIVLDIQVNFGIQ